MSEMTRCNRCSLEAIERDHPGQKVTVGKPVDPKMMAGWVQVFIDGKPHPTWFAEVTEECCC